MNHLSFPSISPRIFFIFWISLVFFFTRVNWIFLGFKENKRHMQIRFGQRPQRNRGTFDVPPVVFILISHWFSASPPPPHPFKPANFGSFFRDLSETAGPRLLSAARIKTKNDRSVVAGMSITRTSRREKKMKKRKKLGTTHTHTKKENFDGHRAMRNWHSFSFGPRRNNGPGDGRDRAANKNPKED